MTSNIRLDWDDITFSECKRRIAILKQDPLVRTLELRLSPQSGFHIILSLFLTLSRYEEFLLRRSWKDDGNRLVKDVMNQTYFRDVLFHYKVMAGTTWYEEPLVTYTRLGHTDIWRTREESRRSLALEPLP